MSDAQPNPKQFLAARKLIKRTPTEVCKDLGITSLTLFKAEGLKQRNSITAPYLASRLRAYYEAADVVFSAGEPGVKLRATSGDETTIRGHELNSENDA